MNHDLFTGDMQEVVFTDQNTQEVTSTLNEDAEIDDILNLVSDPLGQNAEIDEQTDSQDVTYFRNFLADFKTSIVQQTETQELLQKQA